MANTAAHASNEQFLRNSTQFLHLPRRIQELILKSPNAMNDFATFFAVGGEIKQDDKEPLAAYRAEPDRIILVNNKDYKFASRSPEGDYMAERLFSILAHEIGHDKDRSARYSPNLTAEEYVEFRSLKEAKAIFNAFPIFSDLERTEQAFRPQWNAVGYDATGLRWPVLYSKWRDGAASTEETVNEIAAAVPNSPCTRDDGVGDRFKTWRDYYLNEFRQSKRNEQPLMESATEQSAYSPAISALDKNYPDHAMHQDVRRRLVDLYRGEGINIDGEQLERLTAGVMADTRGSQMSRIDFLEFSEDYDTGKPDVNGNIFAFQGDPANPASPYSATPIDKALQTPVEDSYRQFETATQQQAQQWEQFLAQEQELSQSRGTHRTV